MERLGALDGVILCFAEFLKPREEVGFSGCCLRFGLMCVEQKAGCVFVVAGFACTDMG